MKDKQMQILEDIIKLLVLTIVIMSVTLAAMALMLAPIWNLLRTIGA